MQLLWPVGHFKVRDKSKGTFILLSCNSHIFLDFFQTFIPHERWSTDDLSPLLHNKSRAKFLHSAFHSGLTDQEHTCLFSVLMWSHRYKMALLFHFKKAKLRDILGGYCIYCGSTFYCPWNFKNLWCGDCSLLVCEKVHVFFASGVWPGALKSNYKGWTNPCYSPAAKYQTFSPATILLYLCPFQLLTINKAQETFH